MVSSAVPGPGQRRLKVGLPEHGASSGLCRKDPCPIRQGLRWLQERDVNVTAVWTVVKQNQLCSLRRWPSPPSGEPGCWAPGVPSTLCFLLP